MAVRRHAHRGRSSLGRRNFIATHNCLRARSIATRRSAFGPEQEIFIAARRYRRNRHGERIVAVVVSIDTTTGWHRSEQNKAPGKNCPTGSRDGAVLPLRCGVMKSIRNAHIVVVAGKHAGSPLFGALRRMRPRSLSLVTALDKARILCEAGVVDGCLVVLPAAAPDACPELLAEGEAPGVWAGVPSLLFADVITPHVAKSARRLGYVVALPIKLAPRLLYRRIGALLQRSSRHAGRRARVRSAITMSTPRPIRGGVSGFVTPDSGGFKLQ